MRLDFAWRHGILIVCRGLDLGVSPDGAHMPESFDPYYTWLGIPPEEQPADHYRLLGIRRFEANEEVIINATDQRMAFIRTFQTGKRAKESQLLLNEIAAAQTCLLNPQKKLVYDRLLREKLTKSSDLPQTAIERASSSTLAPEVVRQLLPKPTPLRKNSIQPHSVDSPSAGRLATVPVHAGRSNSPIGALRLTPRSTDPASAAKGAGARALAPGVLIGAGGIAAALLMLLGVIIWSAMQGPSTAVSGPARSPSKTKSLPKQEGSPAVGFASPEKSDSEVPLTEPRGTAPQEFQVAPIAVDPVTPDLASTFVPAPQITSPPPAPAAANEPVSKSSDDADPIIARINGRGVTLRRLKLSRNARYLTASGDDRTKCYFADLSEQPKVFSTYNGSDVIVSHDETMWAVINAVEPEDEIPIYRLKPAGDGYAVFKWLYPKEPVLMAAFSGDGKLFATIGIGSKPRLVVYEIATGDRTAVQSHLPSVAWVGGEDDWFVCWSSDGRAEAISLRNPGERQFLAQQLEFPPLTLGRRGNKSPSIYALHPGGAEGLGIKHLVADTGESFGESYVVGLDRPDDLLGVSPSGHFLAVRRDGALALDQALPKSEWTRIEYSDGSPVAVALMDQDGLVAFNCAPDRILVADTKKLLPYEIWRIVRDGEDYGLEGVALRTYSKTIRLDKPRTPPAAGASDG